MRENTLQMDLWWETCHWCLISYAASVWWCQAANGRAEKSRMNLHWHYTSSSSLRLSLSALANNKQSICNSKPWGITMCAWAVHGPRSGGCESVQFQMPVIALMFDGPVCKTEFMVALTLRNQTPRKALNYSPAWNQLLLPLSLYIEGPCWPNGGFCLGKNFPAQSLTNQMSTLVQVMTSLPLSLLVFHTRGLTAEPNVSWN